MVYTHIMEESTAFKVNDVEVPVSIWIIPENTMEYNTIYLDSKSTTQNTTTMYTIYKPMPV